ncbi:MAG TPA: sigma 54-interacting transcriptional regulator [Polyangiaceae bacterium]|nr:sigma 54-interacting transcriptional regulator [Polyangiaceae bacterium]
MAVGGWALGPLAGAGASGNVFRGERRGRSGAVKVFTGGWARDEAELIARLGRQWGPRLLDAGRTPGGEAFIVTEWLDGAPLDAADHGSPREREGRAWIVAHAVARALEELHGAGVRHGDVKPSNVLWHGDAADGSDSPEGRGATLIDLGLASSFGDPARGGTPAYAAPELRGGGDVGPKADLYALGKVLAEIAPASVSIAELVQSLCAPAPGARPSAGWVADRAAKVLGLRPDESAGARAREAMVRRVYLALRAREIAAASEVDAAVGEPTRQWLAQAIDLARQLGDGGENVLGPSTALLRARWLVALVGPAAAGWPVSREPEEALAARLLALAARAPFAAWTYAELRDGPARATEAPAQIADDPALVRRLLEPFPSPALLAAGEERAHEPAALFSVRATVADALLKAGEAARARLVLRDADGAEAAVRRADAARRMGDAAAAEEQAKLASSAGGDVGARAAAIRARLAWDRGDDVAAARLLEDHAGPAAAEVAALIAYRAGLHDVGLGRIDEALVEQNDPLAEARLRAVRGMLEKDAGRADEALASFSRAVELSARVGAVPEEATYLVGEAAAASDAGDVGRALAASTRAAMLLERLGRRREAGRAWLVRAAALATVGARHEADEAAAEAMLAGDTRTRAYARWARVETRPEGDALAREEARAALAELDSGDDRLRAAARALVWCPDALSPKVVDELDAASASASPVARWEWLGARARASLSRDAGAKAQPAELIERLAAVAHLPASLDSRGPALAAARDLAERMGAGEAARRLETLRKQAADRLRATTPDELRDALSHVAWMRDPPISADDSALAPAQIAQLESIVRALSTRDSLRTLLLQVLDAMVLWVGVERGLLLLRAPDGRLVPRAARNLAREDLRGEQLHLSMTLAKRALETGEAVVATDAFASLGDLHASVHALRLRSVLAVPLLSRGEALGVVYLDDRGRRGAFGPRELSWVRLLASQAAMAIADARDQVLLRRAARRAERASKKLAALLEEREAELFATRTELEHARDDDTRFRYDAIAGRSEPMRALLRVVDRVTTSDVPVLVSGESGTGKELIARAMHQNGPRSKRAFVSENCASVPEPLLESTLFGHVRGAFTGASQTRPGLFEVADGGTLFLDEIGEMSLAMQAKLLRVLQDGEVRAVGSERTRRVDVRLIAATHRDLEAMVEKRTFREDLYYRLNVVTVRVPPLRERRADIPLIIAHLVEKHAQGRNVRVTKAAMDRLSAFAWPGNVRQLENEVRRAIVLSTTTDGGAVIDAADLSPELLRDPGEARDLGMDLRARVDALEGQLLREALAKTHGNQTKAAEMLGLSRFGLQKMMKRLKVAGRPS